VDDITQRTPCELQIHHRLNQHGCLCYRYAKPNRRGLPWTADSGWIRKSGRGGGVQGL
jgi:hypothetical protein